MQLSSVLGAPKVEKVLMWIRESTMGFAAQSHAHLQVSLTRLLAACDEQHR